MTIQPCADLLARDVSLFAGSTHTTPVETVPLADVLRRIQDGTYRTAVASLRHLLARGDHARYRLDKEKSTRLYALLRPAYACKGGGRGLRNSSAQPGLCILTWTTWMTPTP